MKRTKCLILILTFVGLLFSNMLTAQGIDDLGVVWTKTYGNGKIYNIKSNPDGTYTASGHPWNNSTPPGVSCLDGLIIEYDETGNEVRRAVVRIPSSYINTHTVTRATAYFNIAFKTDDGGFLAFGSLFNIDASDAEKQPNWTGGASSESPYLTNGTWIVKLDANLKVVQNKLVRGTAPHDAWRTSDNNYVVGGFDANTVGISGTSDSITMLRKYKQDGELDTDSRQNHREINVIYKFPTTDDFIAITPDRLLKIDANLNVTATLIKDALSGGDVIFPYANSISPSIDNGIFINTHLNSSADFVTNWTNGNGIFKIASNNSVPFYKIKKPSDTLFLAPMLLPGNDVPPRYVGVARVSGSGFANSKYYIYELTDNGEFTYRFGKEYPDGTELKAVSMSDGFFSCGQNSVGEAVIAKLSTCAKFIPDVGRTNENILPGQSFSGRTVSHVGNKGIVSYSWALTDITPGGNAIDGWAGITKTGTNNILPVQQFNLAPGKTHALLQYSITALDSYENNGVPQTCQQTYTILVKVQAMPDNITDADCVLDVVGAGWNINKSNIRVGAKVLHAYCAPVAGDLDGNKIPDIVALGHYNDVYAKNVYIYFDRNRTNPKVITTPTVYSRNIGGVAIARVKIGVDTMSLIVVHGTDQHLYAYNANGAINQTPVWTSSTITGSAYTTIGFADFNNDGIPEVYAGKKIYNATTGKELLASPGNFGISGGYNLPAVADVYGDSKLEYIAGNQVYEVNIVNKNDNTGGLNIMTPVKKLTGAEYTDGVTVVADFNRDGKLDVAVRIIANPSRLYIWDVEKEQLIAQATYPNTINWNSVPFVGDIDGNGDLEIIVVSLNKLNVFDYNGTTTLAARPPITIIDASGCTGITLFDFNQDGTAELVYRDEHNLYIYNVVGSTLVAQETIPCGSRTVFEYPIVLDVDADGSAEIVVIGGETSAVSGYLHILKSKTPGTWGPARHVWNQYAYNVVNVNDDLTIPRYQLNPATFFSGDDGVPGINDIQPFNNFLQQQTTLDKNGVPVFLAPEAQLAGNPAFNYMAAADSMVITVYVTNTGDASLQNPFKISVHKNQIPGDNVYTYEHKQQIGLGKTDTITFGISKFKAQWATAPFSDIIIRINDKGDGNNDQAVCNSGNVKYTKGMIIASNDNVLLFNNSIDSEIKVLDNDILPATCTNPIIEILTIPAYTGNATVSGSVIEYTPAAGETADMLRYSVHCGDASKADTATVYIKLIDKPDNISDANCFIKPEVKTFAIKEHTSFGNVNSMSTPLVANLLGNGPEIIVPRVKTASDPWSSNGLVIANVKDNTSREISTVDFATHGQSIVIADVDKDGKCEIFIQNASGGAIHCYNPDGSVKSGFGSGGATIGLDAHYIVQLADLNNDGNVELIAGTYIFDAKTGVLKLNMTFEADGRGYGNPHSMNLSIHTPFTLLDGYYFMPAIGDVDGDGLLEIVGGSTVYKPNAALNGYTTTTVDKVSAPAAFNRYWDGPTVLVDFDLDGHLDVCVIGHGYIGGGIASDYQLYVWSPTTMQIIAYSPAVLRPGTHGNPTIPYVGDLDNNGYPDIAFAVTSIGMATFQYDNTQPGNIKPGPVELKFAETSGFTMFDFNQDGKVEIVYRGTKFFYIVDLNDAKNAYVELSPRISAWSGTIAEYPIVADVDGDGQAEIILTRANAEWAGNNATGVVSVYKTGDATKPWAPARSVWNQWNYNSVNINDDMTIPKFQINPATVFPGEDGQLGTADDVRPYNGFLQQQTILNKNGNPLFLAPNVEIAAPAPVYTYHAAGDSLSITLTILNKGDASLQNDVYITVYKDVVGAGSVKYTYAYPEAIAKGTSKQVTFSIPNFTTWIKPADNNTKFFVKINDKGEAKDHQPVCETGKTIDTKLYSTLLLANNDHAQTLEGNKVTINVLANDSIPTGCTPVISIVSQPANGTAALNATNDSIVYTPDANYVGYDTISYQIKCNNETSIANIYIKVYSKPDNIVDPAACVVPMPKFDFKIKQQWQTVNAGQAQTGTLVGDLDGDGLPEIIAYSPDLTAVNIYNGQTGAYINQIKFPASSFAAAGGWTPHMTSILVDADRNGMAEIIGVNPATREIYSYEAKRTGGVFSLVEKWKASRPFENPFGSPPVEVDNLPHLNVADFNGDGVPELLIYNQIYNAVTGDYLGQTEPMATAHKGCDPGRVTGWNRASNFQTTADFDGDGYPEIVAGGKVYKVNFNAEKTAVTCSVLKSHAGVPDGFTAVADIDMDGNLDVVVVSTSGNTVSLYVWSPLTTWMTKKDIYTSTSGYPAHSFPFVGDIDGYVNGSTGKKHPEICVVTSKPISSAGGRVFAYKYNHTTKALDVKWTLDNTDISGGTGITLFDFNNDGVNELVYRDQTHLRILNGVGVAPVLADPGAIFACASGTAFEYPVIADTDGDGSANICVTCSAGYGIAPHYLRVYESASQPWAPTRRVWNQVNYEPLQINEDLTVPKMAIPKNMAFNGKHPYNGALIQVPIVDENFNPVIPAPDPATAGLKLEAINSTTLRVWFYIQNNGTRFTNASLPITLYHTDTIAANIISTKPIGGSLAPGDMDTLYWDIPSPLPYAKLVVRIQDDGTKYPADGSYLDCDYSNNLDSINILLAVDDIRNANKNTSLAIDVLANDFYGSCGRNALTAFDTIANSGLHMGSLTISSNSEFIYTPEPNKTGVDSVDYYIKCAADSSAARVHILTHSPLSLQYVACTGASVTMGFNPIAGVQYTWYDAETGGAIVAGGTNVNKLIIVKGSAADRIVWWVEPVWKGIKFPRYKVVLAESLYCGNLDATGCTKDGTLLYQEDFGGNKPEDPRVSATMLAPGLTDLNFCATGSGTCGAFGYCFEKYSTYPTFVTNCKGGDDYTSFGDKTRGYYMYIDPAPSQMNYKLYGSVIKDLCPGTNLSFSLWAADFHSGKTNTHTQPKIEMLILDARTKDTIVTTGVFTLHREASHPVFKYRQYGLDFVLPSNTDSILFYIINKEIDNYGNDWALDNIEIRICTPPINLSVGLDTAVCQGTKLDIISTYDEDCTFGDDLTYRWEFKAKNTNTWTSLEQENVTVDCNGVLPANRLTKTWTINPAEFTNEGYYRMLVSSQGNIDKPNCRAMSEVIYLRLHSIQPMPDMRIQACPNLGDINLSSYLDTISFQSVKWTASTLMPPVSVFGIVNTNTNSFNSPFTYKYNYKVETIGNCFVTEGVLYATAIKDKVIKLPPDTVVVCYKNAEALQLNRILGIEAGSKIEAEEVIINTNYVKITVLPAIYYGATFFDGEAVYENSALTGATYDYTGSLTTGIAKKVTFKYTPAPGSCLEGMVYKFVIILTDELVP